MQDVHEEREQACSETGALASTQNSTVGSSATKVANVVGSVLYLFSGPLRPEDGLEKFFEDHKMRCVCVEKSMSCMTSWTNQLGRNG